MNTADAIGRDEAALPYVLVAAPFRSNAAVLGEVLQQNGMAAITCDGEDHFAELVSRCSTLVMSQEALTPPLLSIVSNYLAAQPKWSELPLIILIDNVDRNGAVLSTLRRRLPHSKMTVLQRPVRAIEFVTAAHSALLARRRQLQLRDHIEWQEELQRELNHRVKNILANVMAIFHMTKDKSGSFDAFAKSFEGRLTALSQVHSALAVSQHAQSLRTVADQVLSPYQSSGGDRVIVDGPPVELQPDAAVSLALSLHELATNAAKYGAFSRPEGSVSLTWALSPTDDTGAICVVWIERGGPPVAPPTRQGYGTRFVRSVMRGPAHSPVDIQYLPQGLRCTFVIPAFKLAT